MNERIQELSSQARDYAREYVADCKRYGYYMDHNDYNLRFEAKFAELIVRECVVMTKGYEYALGREDELSKTMREHFGVK